MKRNNNQKISTEQLVLSGLMTALVILFQCLATYTTFFGPFSTAIGLIPIVIGAILCGPIVGTWLGLVFGFVVLFTGGANLFFAFNIIGTIITVLVKGAACGFAAGMINRVLSKYNKTIAAVVAAIICPVVNTAIFLLGCCIFFMPYANELAEIIGASVTGFQVFTVMAFGNFLFEIGMNIILSPIMVRIIQIADKTFRTKRVNKAAKATETSAVDATEPTNE